MWFVQIEMGALTEEKASRIEGTLGNHYDSPTLLGTAVDDCLYLLCLYVGGALSHAIARQHVLASKV